jgi:hypothetical protein
VKTIFSVFIFSVPMTVIQSWLEGNTKLVRYSRRWSWFHTLSVLTLTFWSSRLFIASIRLLNQKRKGKWGQVSCPNQLLSLTSTKNEKL